MEGFLDPALQDQDHGNTTSREIFSMSRASRTSDSIRQEACANNIIPVYKFRIPNGSLGDGNPAARAEGLSPNE